MTQGMMKSTVQITQDVAKQLAAGHKGAGTQPPQYKLEPNTPRNRKRRRNVLAYLPMIPGWEASHLAKLFILHPLVLSQLADSTTAAEALQSRATRDSFTSLSVVQAVERSMHAAGRSGRRGLRGPLGRAQSCRNIERRLGRAQLAILKRKTLLARRGGGVVGGSARTRVHGRRVAVYRDLVDGGSCSGHNVSGHVEGRLE